MKKVLRVLLVVSVLAALLYGAALAEQGGSINYDGELQPIDKISFVSWLNGPGSSSATVSGTKAKISWAADSSYQQSGYVVHLNRKSSTYQSTGLGFYTTGDDGYYYLPIKLLKQTSSTSCTVDLKTKGTYYLTIYSYYSSPSSYMSSRCRILKVTVTSSGTSLGKPTGVKVKQTGATKVQLTWKAGANAKSYAIYRATGSGSFKKIGTTKKLKYIDKKVKKGNTYKYKIQAIKGSKKVYSSVVKITIPKASSGSVTYRAILLSNTYAGTSNPLPMCDDDRYAMEKMLANLGATSYTVYTKKNMTASGMESAIRSVFSLADDDDVTILYYTGHGLQSYYSTNIGALCGNDGNSFIYPYQLRGILDDYKGKKVVLLNSCHSGAMIGKDGSNDAKSVAQQINSSFIEAFYSPLDKSGSDLAASSYYVLTACKSEQTGIGVTSRDRYGNIIDKYSIFTRALVDGLGWNMKDKTRYSSLYADSNGDKKVTLAECYRYTKKGVDEMEAFFNSAPYYWGMAMDVQVYPTNCAEVFFAR